MLQFIEFLFLLIFQLIHFSAQKQFLRIRIFLRQRLEKLEGTRFLSILNEALKVLVPLTLTSLFLLFDLLRPFCHFIKRKAISDFDFDSGAFAGKKYITHDAIVHIDYLLEIGNTNIFWALQLFPQYMYGIVHDFCFQLIS